VSIIPFTGAARFDKMSDSMKASKRRFILFAAFLVAGAAGLLRFSQGVRNVDALGLFASGAIFGASLAGVLGARRERAAE